jgi:hypothetical protein
MQMPKEQILSLIEKRLGGGQAQEAANQLPDKVDPRATRRPASKFGIDP